MWPNLQTQWNSVKYETIHIKCELFEMSWKDCSLNHWIDFWLWSFQFTLDVPPGSLITIVKTYIERECVCVCWTWWYILPTSVAWNEYLTIITKFSREETHIFIYFLETMSRYSFNHCPSTAAFLLLLRHSHLYLKGVTISSVSYAAVHG